MNTLDFLILIPIAIGFIFGLFKGLVKELTSLAAIFLGIYGAKFFAPIVSSMLVHSFHFSEKTATPIAYLLLFITIAVLLLILAKFLDKIFSSLSLDGLNKLLGGVFGALKFALIVSVLLNVFNALDSRFSLVKAELIAESIGYQPVMKLAPTLWEETKKAKVTNSENDMMDDEKVEAYR